MERSDGRRVEEGRITSKACEKAGEKAGESEVGSGGGVDFEH